MQVEVFKHKDVRGKELPYVKISNAKGEVLINIGEGNYNKLKFLQDDIKEQDNAVHNKTNKVR